MTLEQAAQALQHVRVGITAVTLADDPLRRVEHLRVHNGLEHAVGPDPHVRRIDHAFLFQLVGFAVVDVVADVFLVGEDLVHHLAGPVAAKVGLDAAGIEIGGDPAFGFSTLDELAIDIADDLDFLGGAGGEDDAVGLQALVLAARQLGFPLAILADQDAAQPKSCGAALAIAQLDQAAPYQSGPGKDLGRQLAAVFARHGAFHAFDDGGDGAAVILELHRNETGQYWT